MKENHVCGPDSNCDAECMENSRPHYCEAPRSGMYATGTNSRMDQLASSCGDYAPFEINGKALCEVHARREQ